MNKRDFLISGSAALAAAPTVASATASSRPATAPMRPAQRPDLLQATSASDWHPYVGDHFEFEGQQVTLKQVKLLDSAAGQHQFDLVFEHATSSPTGLGRLHHGATGQQLMLHLSEASATRVVAHFNLLAASQG